MEDCWSIISKFKVQRWYELVGGGGTNWLVYYFLWYKVVGYEVDMVQSDLLRLRRGEEVWALLSLTISLKIH